VEVTIMQIVGMAAMGNRDMPTMLSMDMGVLIVSGMAHEKTPLRAMNDSCSLSSIPHTPD
jgi:hypothetical protein